MTTTFSLTDQPEFQALLPWAKAVAKSISATELMISHFLIAALKLAGEAGLHLPPKLLTELRQALASTASGLVLNSPCTDKFPLSSQLRESIALDGQLPFQDWVERIAKRFLADRAKDQLNEGTDSSLAPTSPVTVQDEPQSDPSSAPGMAELTPWLQSAMSALGEDALTARSLGLGLIHALQSGALDKHHDLRHFLHGHADELRFWLQHSNQLHGLSNKATSVDTSVMASKALQESANKHEKSFKAPTVLWQWLHAAVQEANDYACRLQVAYHEAGHAVAIHLLIPEGVYETITIEPKGSSGGRVSHGRNESFERVYMNSLEQVMEMAVVALAGRAAEVHRFGKMRADSGALSDMATATEGCWRAITTFGLDPVFGLIVPAPILAQPESGSPFIAMAPSGWLHDLAQQRLHVWIHWAQREAQRLVEENWTLVEALAEELMHRKTINNVEARQLLAPLTSEKDYQLSPIPN